MIPVTIFAVTALVGLLCFFRAYGHRLEATKQILADLDSSGVLAAADPSRDEKDSAEIADLCARVSAVLAECSSGEALDVLTITTASLVCWSRETRRPAEDVSLVRRNLQEAIDHSLREIRRNELRMN